MASGEWRVLSLDEKMAKRHGMPPRVPVPDEEMESLGSGGLSHDNAQKWIKAFVAKAGAPWRAKNAADAKAYDAYLAKMAPWAKAQAAFARQDFESAQKSLRLVTNLDPNDFSAKQSLATVYAASGQAEQALSLFDQIAEVWNGVADFHVAYANACLMGARKDDALEQFVLALEAQSDCRPAMEGLVGLGMLIKIYEDPHDAASLVFVRTDSIVKYLEGQWDATEHDLAYYFRQIGYHEDEGRFEAMLAAAERALRTDASNEAARLAKARALRKLDRLEAAKQAAEAVLAENPSSASAHVELAECALASKDDAAAGEELDRALALEPGHLTALTLKFLPRDATDLAGVQTALSALDGFAETHAAVAGAWRVAARAQGRAGNEGACIERLKKAVELAPDDDDLRAEYWTELAKAGRFADVLTEAERVGDMSAHDWRLRWSEAEALNGAGKRMEARGAFMAINADTSLHVAIRARAKRAVTSLAG
ncbi:MAG TPA: tetratricopeptide repeat protein [Polyangiaceae bacterium]